MSPIHFYHNPRCSKSRQALKLLEEKGENPTVIEYLKTPLTAAQILQLKDQLCVASVRDFMRVKEPEYKDLALREVVDEQQLAETMAKTPKLMERPIAVKEDKAVIGRPPENVLDLL